MPDETQTIMAPVAPEVPEGKRPVRGRGSGRSGERRGYGPRRGGRGGRRDEGEAKEFDQKILELARVTRVTKGGKRMRFRATVVIGDHKGRVGLGVAKGADVAMAVDKATRQARKGLFTIPLVDGTFLHAVEEKFSATTVLLKPAPRGTGLKAGGAVRVLLELGGVPNAVSKIFGSTNKINVARATMQALRELQTPQKSQS
jgi:small subunit ribosomal protein S5